MFIPKNSPNAIRRLRSQRELAQKNSGLIPKKIEYEITLVTGNIDGAGMYTPGAVTINLIGDDGTYVAIFTNDHQFSVIKQTNCFSRGQETTFYATCAIGNIKNISVQFDNTGKKGSSEKKSVFKIENRFLNILGDHLRLLQYKSGKCYIGFSLSRRCS